MLAQICQYFQKYAGRQIQNVLFNKVINSSPLCPFTAVMPTVSKSESSRINIASVTQLSTKTGPLITKVSYVSELCFSLCLYLMYS